MQVERTETKILASNQVVGPLFRELLEAFCSAGLDVKLLAGSVDAPEGYVGPFARIHACRLRKVPAWRRIVTWGLFTCQALRAMARDRDRFAFLVSNPPLVPWVAPLARWLFGLRYGLLIYDVYPDVMVRAGLIRPGGLAEKALRSISAMAMRKAECVITLGAGMAETLGRHFSRGPRADIRVVSNWADTKTLRPLPKAENPFAVEHGLVDKFVVMYSGAFSDSHDIRSIVEAAELLQDEGDIEFILIGEGAQRRAIERWVTEKALNNCRLLPWQPLDGIRYSLAAADCQIVSMDAGRQGTLVPSKIYPALAVGAAPVVISPPGTEIVEIVRTDRCGVWVPPRSPAELADALRRLHRDPAALAACKTNARNAAERKYDLAVCSKQYVEILRRCLGERPNPTR